MSTIKTIVNTIISFQSITSCFDIADLSSTGSEDVTHITRQRTLTQPDTTFGVSIRIKEV